MQDADARCYKDAVFGGFQHVQRLGVGEAGVVDEVNAVAQCLLDAGARACVHDDAFATHFYFLGCRSNLGIGHPGGVRIGTWHKVVARQIEFDTVHAVFQKHTHHLAHVVGTVDVDAKAVLGERQVRQRLVTQAARHGDLLAGGKVARAGDLPAVDRVADDNVKPGLGASRAETTGEACLQVALRDFGTPKHMLFQRHGLNAGQSGGVVPRKMGMRFHHAGHERRASRVNHRSTTGR